MVRVPLTKLASADLSHMYDTNPKQFRKRLTSQSSNITGVILL